MPGSEAVEPPLREEPRIDDQDPAGRQVADHGRHRPDQVLGGGHVADRAEEAGDRVERGAEVEAAHVALVDLDARHLLAGQVGHVAAALEPRDREPVPQVLEVPPGAAGHVEQRPGLGPAAQHEAGDLRRLGRVVLADAAVHGVVEQRRAVVQAHGRAGITPWGWAAW
jgi:hypothetical protein